MSSSSNTHSTIGVNGFGRIGRLVSRIVLTEQKDNVAIGLINDPFMTAAYMAYLLAHDSTHGKFPGTVESEGNTLKITVSGCGGPCTCTAACACKVGRTVTIATSAFKDATQIPWADHGVDIVAETSGVNTDRASAVQHLSQGARRGGARKVVISAPAKDDDTPTFVVGVNHHLYDPLVHHVVSNASCTTNCLAPLAAVVDEAFGLAEGIMTTVHAATATQALVDGPCHGGKDWRGGRAALNNIIPSSTGAAKAVGQVLPGLKGKLTGMAFRVPLANVSVVDLTCRLLKPTSIADIAEAIEKAALGATGVSKRVLGVTREDVVSSDFNGDPRSCIFDAKASIALSPTFVKLIAYYDNEWAYSCRTVDLMLHMTASDAAAIST